MIASCGIASRKQTKESCLADDNEEGSGSVDSASHDSLARRYDAAYGEFVELLPRPDESHPSLWLPGNRGRILSGKVRPGAVARSMLFGAFALNPGLRTNCQTLLRVSLKRIR